MIFRDRSRRSLHWAEAFGASAVVHLGAAIFAFGWLDGIDILNRDSNPNPEIEISPIILAGDQLPSPDQPLSNAPIADTLQDGEGYDVPAPVVTAPEEPTPVEEPEAEEDAEQPETEITPEEELEPVIAETVEPQAEALAPIAQAAAAPQPVSPLRPEAGSSATLAPVATAPSLGAIATVAPVATPTTSSLAPVSGSVPQATASALQPLSTLPDRPAPQTQLAPTPDGPAAGGAVSELVARIRGNVATACLLAIPQERQGIAPELVMTGDDDAAMQVFSDTILTDISPEPSTRSVLVDSRQCAALNFIRQNSAYPAFRLSFSLDEDSIRSGDTLTGSIGNTAGRYISLVLVDDNGVVQDLGSFLTFAGGEARFEVPMRRAGGARDTSALLVAFATNSRPTALSTENGQLAERFFAAMQDELGSNAPLVVVSFDIR